MKEDNVVGYECRFAVHTPSKYNDGADLHFVKEIKHFKDGTTKPSIRLIENYKRDFYITKKGFRNHKTKKEREEISKLTKYSTTQSKLEHAVARALEEPWKAGQRSGLRGLCQSPYVYGTDILSTSLIKKSYADKWPGLVTPNTVAVYDIETDVIRGTKEIIMATISFKDRVFTAIHKDHVKGHYGVEEKLDKLLTKYLSEYIVSRNVKWEVKIVETPADCVIQCIKKAHEWQPDFLAIWNIDFDIPTSVAALQKVGIDPATVFSDPIVPKKYQYFDYKQGSKQKVTASGKKSPIPPSQQWHTVFTPASFYIIDAMCVYRQIRAGQAELPSYALDYVMNNHLDRGKLKFEEADELSGIDWHVFMQETYPLEYVIYNVFDCIGMELLDEKILDLQLSFPIMAEFSDFCNFKSQPRRLCDTVHFECLESGYVFASTSDKMGDELDLLTVSCKDWIITLPAHSVEDNGLCLIKEYPELRSNVRANNADLDATAAYPSGECVYNISKETTVREICKIENVTERQQRDQGLNLSGGHTNAVEFTCSLLGYPTMHQLLVEFEKTLSGDFCNAS